MASASTNLSIAYINLSEGLGNIYASATHACILDKLRELHANWYGVRSALSKNDLLFIIVTKRGNVTLQVKGPSTSAKLGVVDFSLYIPEHISSLGDYIDNVFLGVSQSVSRYESSAVYLQEAADLCKRALGELRQI